MSQQSVINGILKYLETNQPSDYAKFMSMPAGEMNTLVGGYSSSNPTMFKPRPPGQQGNTCYWSADYHYAAALVLCDAISDPKIKSDCKDSAMDAYCNAHAACEPA